MAGARVLPQCNGPPRRFSKPPQSEDLMDSSTVTILSLFRRRLWISVRFKCGEAPSSVGLCKVEHTAKLTVTLAKWNAGN
ncbi:hypothetical protein GCM10027403_23120 [Arthrobacter tecti]